MRWFETHLSPVFSHFARLRRDPRLWQAVAVGVTALVALCAVFEAVAEARPGGGESYGGGGRSGGSSSGGGGGGGGGDAAGLIIELVILCIRYPALGGVVAVGVIIFLVVQRAQGARMPDWSVGVPQAQVQPARTHYVAKGALDRLRGEDPHFSVILFEDFIYTLYATLHTQRGARGLEKLAPYLDAPVRQALHDPALQAVSGIVIGSLRYVALRQPEGFTQIELEVEANLEETRNGKPERLYLVERLVLMRPRTARSRPKERARTLDCPNCGSPLETITGNVCGYCRERVDDGRFDWMIRAIRCVKMERRPPLLTGDVQEQGTQEPTLVTPGAEQRLQQLSTRDPAFNYSNLLARVQVVFSELQAGWAAQDLLRIRPHVSDNLLQYFAYWFAYYARAQARNVTERARVLHIDLANVLSDSAYDAITLRVFATGLDYTLSNDGKLLKGSRSRERPYTEYWTLIRGRGAQGAAKVQLACPNCGAPLKINMAGSCEYCRVKVVSGDFDWVLSRIEQDESYDG